MAAPAAGGGKKLKKRFDMLFNCYYIGRRRGDEDEDEAPSSTGDEAATLERPTIEKKNLKKNLTT